MVCLACIKSAINDSRYFLQMTLGETFKVRVNFPPKPSAMVSDLQMGGGPS